MTQSEIYTKYFKLALRICKKYFNDDKAFDVCQDTFINKIFPAMEKFREEGSFEGFLKRIITNSCLDELRKSKQQFVSDDVLQYHKSEENEDEEDMFKNPEIQKRALELVENLPPMYKKVFKMYTIDGLKHREIADKLGISDSTSKTNYMKAKKHIQKGLAKEPIIEKRIIKTFEQFCS